jgi:hypothetical protein
VLAGGELCALRWRHVDLERAVVTVRRAIAQDGNDTEEKDTKTHQRRHVTIDPGTVAALIEHRQRWEARMAALGLEMSPDAFVFSNSPDGSTSLKPSSVTQRYGRMADRLGIDTHLHNLRHYSATELIAAGVDVRTVAGRLGHGGGGTTTLRVYAAWVAELLARVVAGSIKVGDQLPTGKQLGAELGVATATAQRAVALLQTWEVVEVSRGRRAVVRARDVARDRATPKYVADATGEDGSE